jgi:hypothetical protein
MQCKVKPPKSLEELWTSCQQIHSTKISVEICELWEGASVLEQVISKHDDN